MAGIAVTAPWLPDDRCPGQAGKHRVAVLGAVVDNHDLAADAMLVEDALRCRHTLGDALGLVQARDHDRDGDRIAYGSGPALPEDANRHVLDITRRPTPIHPPQGLGRLPGSLGGTDLP